MEKNKKQDFLIKKEDENLAKRGGYYGDNRRNVWDFIN